MTAILFCILVLAVSPSNYVRRFAEKFYRARVECDSGFIKDATSDTLNPEYSLIESGDFRYTGFTIKGVEKIDSSLYRVYASLKEGFKEWESVGIIDEISILRCRAEGCRVVSLKQTYKNAVIRKSEIKDTSKVYILKNSGLVILSKIEPSGFVRLSVNKVDSSIIQNKDSCPSLKFIHDFFPSENKEIESKIITLKHNSIRFCFIKGGTEGAAGHLYHYLYFIPQNIGDIVFSFVVETENCDNYDEDQRDGCRKENIKHMQYPLEMLQLLRLIK